MVAFNNMFTPLNQNHNYNTCAAINHLLDIPQKQICHCGTYSIVFTASKLWNDGLAIIVTCHKHVLYCEVTAFKKTIFQRFFSKYNENSNWNDWALFCKIAIHGDYQKHIVFFYQYSISQIQYLNFIFCIYLPVIVLFTCILIYLKPFPGFSSFFYFLLYIYIYFFSIINS